MRAESFLLGVHRSSWLSEVEGVPLFVSRAALASRRSLPRAATRWALDSGGFTELDRRGGWALPAAAYAAEVRRYRDEVGRMEWAAPQDWMCEPRMLERTGLTVVEHQRRTVANLLELREVAPDLRFVPVLQGWTLDDYLRCAERYERAGVDLAAEPLVGLGTVCRRQDTSSAGLVVRRLAAEGVRLHGFGIKVTGLLSYADALASCDSMAWSIDARWRANHGEPSCDPRRRRSCANCLHFALEWRERVAPLLDPPNRRLWEEVPCAV